MLDTPVSIQLHIPIQLFFLNVGVLLKQSLAFPFPQLAQGTQGVF